MHLLRQLSRGSSRCSPWSRRAVAPRPTPIRTACFDPTSFITARTSSILVSRVGTSATRSDTPVPRLSTRSAARTMRELRTTRESRLSPCVLHVGDHPRDEDEIGRTLAQNLVRDADLPTAGVACLRWLHASILRTDGRGGKVSARCSFPFVMCSASFAGGRRADTAKRNPRDSGSSRPSAESKRAPVCRNHANGTGADSNQDHVKGLNDAP